MMRAMPGNGADDATGALQRILSSEEDDRLVDDLLDALPVGVIVLDRLGRVIRYNSQEQALSHRSRQTVLGKSFFDEVAPCTRASDLAPAFARYVEEGGSLTEDIQLQFPFPHYPTPREVRLRLRGFSSRGMRFAFLLVEDITEEVQGQRLRELLATLVAHDMKNPLAAVRLNVDMVMRDLSSARTPERLGEARLAADRLDRMIRLFLDVYRLESAELVLAPSSFDAYALLQEVVQLQRPLAEVSQLTLVAEGVACPIVTDPGLFQRIVDNLLDNALRHARGRVDARLVPLPGGEGLRLEITDDGPGVPDEAKTRVFDKFATMASDLRGYNQGLGLAFCSLAVGRLGGSIDVVDAQPNGAVFRVTLPVLAPTLFRAARLDLVGERVVHRERPSTKHPRRRRRRRAARTAGQSAKTTCPEPSGLTAGGQLLQRRADGLFGALDRALQTSRGQRDGRGREALADFAHELRIDSGGRWGALRLARALCHQNVAHAACTPLPLDAPLADELDDREPHPRRVDAELTLQLFAPQPVRVVAEQLGNLLDDLCRIAWRAQRTIAIAAPLLDQLLHLRQRLCELVDGGAPKCLQDVVDELLRQPLEVAFSHVAIPFKRRTWPGSDSALERNPTSPFVCRFGAYL